MSVFSIFIVVLVATAIGWAWALMPRKCSCSICALYRETDKPDLNAMLKALETYKDPRCRK